MILIGSGKLTKSDTPSCLLSIILMLEIPDHSMSGKSPDRKEELKFQDFFKGLRFLSVKSEEPFTDGG
jgi:hypothetical protein